MTSLDEVTSGQPRHPWRGRGNLVTLGTVVSLVAGLGLTVLGLGAADQAVASYDAASWVWSRAKGEIARINGVTAKVDTRVDVPHARGHQMQVSQTDRYLMLRDVDTGVISAMDLTTLQASVTQPTNPGIGIQVALLKDAAFVVDTVQGVVQQIDPRSLGPIGAALHYPPGITGGMFDGKGRLWIAIPSQGTVSAITAAALPSPGNGGMGASAPIGPKLVSTSTVAPPNHELEISTLDDGVAVLNRTTEALTTISAAQQKTTTLPLHGPGALAPHTDGRSVPVTVAAARHVYVVGVGGQRGADFAVPGAGARVQPAVAWQGYFYVADDDTGMVHVFDGAGHAQPGIAFPRPGGPLELDVRENHLFINAPGSSTAQVVDDQHAVRPVDKYADDVLGGDPPPVPPAPPPRPPKPVVSKPGPPRAVRAAAGNSEARVTWQAAAANGAAITRYVVVGDGRTFQVGANQRSVEVTGLTNGETYRFEVHAVNAKGDGPSRTSNVVKPTSEVPDPPGTPSAVAKPNGSVVVSWPAANGQGLKIDKYQVTAVSNGAAAPAGTVTGTSLIIKDGELTYGQQYAFTVVAVNERGAGSKASPVSNTVSPFTTPDKPENVTAQTVGDQAGAIKMSWTAPAANGRPITAYAVTAGGKTSQVTDGGAATTLTGFGAGETVQVQVTAVNEAGASAPATASARTVDKPALTVTGTDVTYKTATMTFSVDAGGGTASCTLTASPGGSSKSGSCASLAVGDLLAGTKYTLTLTAKNAAGSVSHTATPTTDYLSGTATCVNGQNGDTATYCDKDVSGRNGNEIFSVTEQDNARQVGWVPNGTRLQAYCKKTGESVYAYIYNDDKRSTWWIQVDYKGRNYIPWAWLNLDGHDDLDALPKC